uniref:Uncharacterized protein n=1 Tax=Rhizophora mucronata TaxID=61149 RepID=A0A2P2PGX8_RHIMU
MHISQPICPNQGPQLRHKQTAQQST